MNGKCGCLLVIEDYVLICVILKSLLECWNFEVFFVGNVVEVCEFV